MSSAPASFLVFGDLHGRVLPAFRLAACWSREHHTPLAGLLQVGDLGYFPDLTRLDKATIRHAKDDPLELGVQDLIRPTEWADTVFADPYCPPALWFTAGNHEDFAELERLAHGHARDPHFPVDHYLRVNAIQDGQVSGLAGGVRVGAIWGVDGKESTRRTNLPNRGYIRERSADRLLHRPFDVLLCHDAPYSAKRAGFGSTLLVTLIELAQPAFAFFGHYKGVGSRSAVGFGATQVYHLAGFELHGPDGTADDGSVGLLTWADGRGAFEYLDPAWLRTFGRGNWKWR
ncbi:MAG: metallophosphoesterase [Gemmataceae bacterium]